MAKWAENAFEAKPTVTFMEAYEIMLQDVLQAICDLVLDEGYYVPTRAICKGNNWDPDAVRVCLRQLRKDGLAEFSRGLMQLEECTVAGSGYAPTAKGREQVAEWKA